jgi:UDP-3-O-[3-hydroxymyristoyl] glucosamine N-acyltransferase
LVGTYTLGEIASRLGGRVLGDSNRKIAGIQPLDRAGPEDLSFVTHPRYRNAASGSRAGALIVGSPDPLQGHDLVVVENPYAALASAMDLFFTSEAPEPGISPHAVIGEAVRLGERVSIGPFVVVGRRCRLGDGVVLMPHVVLGEDVSLGSGTVLHPGVVVYARCVLGERVAVHAASVIGSDGFGYAETEGARSKIPQVGNVEIGDDVEIGAGTTIDRATFGSTVVGRGTKIDNLVQVAHNVTIGEDSVLVAQSGIAGSSRLGRRVILAGQSGVAGHLSLGERSVVGAKSAVLQDLPPGSFVLGTPARDHREWKRGSAAERRLPELLRRVARLEKALADGGAGKRAAAGRRTRGRARARGTGPRARRSG